jgi:hypothetical protein
MNKEMRIKAPFHVGTDFGFDWILFAFRAELAWIDQVMWEYFQCQRLATQRQRLKLQSDFEKWQRKQKRGRRDKRNS